ncbi:hypothetical protein BH23CHL5_BH23CHL5_28830 [soil metagenome]
MDVEITEYLDVYLPRLVRAAIIVVIAVLLIRTTFVSRMVFQWVDRRAERGDHEAAQRLDTITRAIFRLIQFGIGIMALVLVLDEFGFDTTAIVASAGIAGIAISFGAQALIRDFLNGTMILFEDQYRVGDIVTVANVTGTVEDIDLRITTLRDLNGTVHFVPNGEIRLTSNLTRNYGGILLDFPIGYEVDIAKAKAIINQVGADLAQDPDWSERVTDPPRFIRLQDFEETGVLVRVMGRTQPGYQWAVTGELRLRLKTAFDEAGIEMPLSQIMIWRARDVGQPEEKL